jgi:hypothetical protein
LPIFIKASIAPIKYETTKAARIKSSMVVMSRAYYDSAKNQEVEVPSRPL